MIPLVITLSSVLTFIGGAGVVTIVVFFGKWARFAPIDKVTKSKIQAEANKIQADADVAISNVALNLVKEVQADAKEAKQKLEKTQADLAKFTQMCKECTLQTERLKIDLTNAETKNREMTAKIDELLARITELLVEIEKLKKDRNIVK